MAAELEEDEEYFIIKEDIPRQLANKDDLEMLQSTADTASDALALGFAMTFGLNLILSGVMSQLWNVFNTLQIITALPLLSVILPANLTFVF